MHVFRHVAALITRHRPCALRELSDHAIHVKCQLVVVPGSRRAACSHDELISICLQAVHVHAYFATKSSAKHVFMSLPLDCADACNFGGGDRGWCESLELGTAAEDSSLVGPGRCTGVPHSSTAHLARYSNYVGHPELLTMFHLAFTCCSSKMMLTVELTCLYRGFIYLSLSHGTKCCCNNCQELRQPQLVTLYPIKHCMLTTCNRQRWPACTSVQF